MVRKRQLIKANHALIKQLHEAQSDLADRIAYSQVLSSEVVKLTDKNIALAASNERLCGKLNEALTANRRFAEKARRANDLFGKALAQVSPERGPSRPNRKKLTEREVKDIREAFRGGMKQKDLAENYGVNPATISRTVRGIYH